MQLTPEQQRIVAHATGPAVVYAVAGAGKSTTMAYRVQALVARGVRPERILVSSFSRETVAEIRRKIESLDVHGVACLTFNALGRRIVHYAVQQGHWPAFDEKDMELRPAQLALRAMLELSRRLGKSLAELEINTEDLQTWISICKGNLLYAEFSSAHVAAPAGQAKHNNPHYLAAYRLYEELRQQGRYLTFDDQLLLAWEAMTRFPTIRTWASQCYDYVLIDEFQDVNRAQVEIADMLTETHRNYMAIGDDDQCIYEWRGAAVQYILDFRQRYNAAAYVISDNFRCPAEAALLAGQVIALNQQRQIKPLIAQKGFGGLVRLQGFATQQDLAQQLVGEYQRLCAEGMQPEQAVVLVRSYAQTPAIEARLIQAGCAYRIVGSQRFYQRPEVKVLLTYLSFARQESEWQPHVTQVTEQYGRRFSDIIRQPNRYLSHDWIRQVVDRAQQEQCSIISLLEAGLVPPPQEAARKRITQFIHIIKYLQQHLNAQASTLLTHLVKDLDYLNYLQQSAGVAEQGEERCQNVKALLTYATGKGDVLSFLQHVRQLHVEDEHIEQHSQGRLTLMSIHRAKGLEWPVVFIPCAADDQLPAPATSNLEEERRLLYVALTRCQRQVHVLYAPEDKLSRFLLQVQAAALVQQADGARRALQNPEPRMADILQLLATMRSYPLIRYLQQWWRPTTPQLQALSEQLQQALPYQQAARQQVASYQQKHVEYQQQLAHRQVQVEQWQSMERRIQLFRKHHIKVQLTTTLTTEQLKQKLYFRQQGNNVVVLSKSGRQIGVVDRGRSRFPVAQVLDWSWLVGVVPNGGYKLTPDQQGLFSLLVLSEEKAPPQWPALPEPEALPALISYLATDDFAHDCQQLLNVFKQLQLESVKSTC